MKRKLLPLAIAAVAVPGAAMAEPTTYGRLDLSLDKIEMEAGGATTTDNWQVNSHSSRLGFKGDAALSNGLTAIYQYEVEINPDEDDTDSGDFMSARNQFVGVEGDFGTVRIGRIDTPLKKAQGKIDQFSDHAADIKNLVTGEERVKNTINYKSPRVAEAFQVSFSVYPGEQAGANAEDDGIADAMSGSVTYEQAGIYAALALDIDQTGYSNGWARADGTRIVLGMKQDAFEAGFLYQMSENAEDNASDEDNGWVISGALNVGRDAKLKGQFGSSEYDPGNGNDTTDTDLMAIGVEQKLAKGTKVYAEYTSIEVGDSSEDTTFSFGIQHKF